MAGEDVTVGSLQPKRNERHLTNSLNLAQRNATYCTNLTCSNTEYYPLEQEKCPDCNKTLKRTIKDANPYVKIGD